MRRLTLPSAVARWAVRNARIPTALLRDPAGRPDGEGLVGLDLIIDGDRIAAVGPGLDLGDLPFVDAGLGMVLPCPVDIHTHLDKGHIWPRAPNPDGTRDRAIETVGADRAAHWTAEDVRARMEFGLACAYAHGTAAIRTHLDSLGPQIRISWPVFGEIRDRWRDRIDLEATPLFGIEFALDDAHLAAVAEMVGEFGRVLGAVTYPGAVLRPALDRMFRLAADKGWDLDFHIDETGDASVNTLATVAETALAHRFEGKILAGHCCALSLLPEDERRRTIDLVARAGIAVVSLPMCNMYLQEREEGTPRWRGTTAFKELAEAGVPVMIASDNTRDSFYAHGDLDMAEVWREGTRILHLDHPFGDWARTVAATPADVMRRPERGRIGAGLPADFILFTARTMTEWLARPQSDRIVIRRGRPIAAVPPFYAALDHLEGLKP
ncbi:MAG TPA: cytosine deaminase [Lichenihabitans sp.]|jgi:cytosine deaminase|nr:cytosine deaminase [Lichenihabitans sp.]